MSGYEAEELTQAQESQLLAALVEMKSELTSQIAAGDEGAKPVDLDLPIGRISRMDAMQQQAMQKAGLEGLKHKLRLVSLALASGERGDYGFCRECDEPVGFPRLKARPETPFCISCQEAKEGGG